MSIRIAINGFGRIGRNVFRAIYERGLEDELEIIAINDLGDAIVNAHLLQFDSLHGRFQNEVEVNDKALVINGREIRVCAERDPGALPWAELNVDIVIESTGYFRSRDKASAHIEAGAKRVLISAPGKGGGVPMVVYGCNEQSLRRDDIIVSNASCTTNCLAPVLKVMNEQYCVESGLMTTVHSYTNDQQLIDGYHTDLRRTRAAATNMVPTSTGAAEAVAKVMPEFEGKLTGFAIRVPTPNVSLVDLSAVLSKNAQVKDIIDAFEEAQQGRLAGILRVEHHPLVSSDFNHDPASSIVDASTTLVGMDGKHVKICAWYDNEWGYSNRMIDTARHMGTLL